MIERLLRNLYGEGMETTAAHSLYASAQHAPISSFVRPDHLLHSAEDSEQDELDQDVLNHTEEQTELAPPSAKQPYTSLSLNASVGTSQLGRWNDGAWRLDAACATMDTLIFFPIGETGPATPQVQLAKKICASCPVREECLEFAIATIQNDGIWGGTTEDERRLIKRARRVNARKAAQQAAQSATA